MSEMTPTTAASTASILIKYPKAMKDVTIASSRPKPTAQANALRRMRT